jgi:hypothetical protein
MFMGVTAEGINREVATMIEGTLYCRREGVLGLATVQFALWHMAMVLAGRIRDNKQKPRGSVLCRGILPSLEYLFHHEFDNIKDNDSKTAEAEAAVPPTDVNKSEWGPGGVVEYWCSECSYEIGNAYRFKEGRPVCMLCADLWQ